MKQVNIYYKDGKLNKSKTCRSILAYYIKCIVTKQPIRKVTFQGEIY